MRKVKAASVLALTKAYAAVCAEAGLYSPNPAKADWKAIVAKVTTDGGMLRIPWAYQQGDMHEAWTRAYDAAKRQVKAGKPLAKAAPKPKARKRTPKPKASDTVTLTVTKEQAAILAELLAAASA